MVRLIEVVGVVKWSGWPGSPGMIFSGFASVENFSADGRKEINMDDRVAKYICLGL